MSGQVSITVLVVAYGDPAHLRHCLAELDAAPGVVTVVDNGRSDATLEVAGAAGAAYVRPEANLGFAAGVNRGLAAWEGASDVLLLNPDAALPWSGVAALQDHLRSRDQLAAVAPSLRRPGGGPEPASWPMPSPAVVWLDALGLSRLQRGPRFLTGAVLLLRAEALRELGGLDERFFLYAEESDWQLRALRAGWDVEVVPEVTAMHLGGATSDSATVRSEHFHRSARLFARKWYGQTGALLMLAASLTAALRRTLTGGRSGRAEALAMVRTYLRRAA